MGHIVKYEIFPGNWMPQQVIESVIHYIKRHGTFCSNRHVYFPTDRIFATRNEAEAFLNQVDAGWHYGVAVKIIDYTNIRNGSKLQKLQTKKVSICEKKQAYAKEHSVKQWQAALVSCRKCGSKLNREQLIDDVCPVCHMDLRGPTTLERLNVFDKQIIACEEEIRQETLKQMGNTQWIVRFEYFS